MRMISFTIKGSCHDTEKKQSVGAGFNGSFYIKDHTNGLGFKIDSFNLHQISGIIYRIYGDNSFTITIKMTGRDLVSL
ncbi:hypothetical protein HYN46_09935 [Aquirhabdus parva]|uniref:Uncharacterized protein n=1 Tax=Aquirhabdus parva TaxID=2283318 RepID=A0A345P771_9GAMM|nr:hypothetical protein HYN46_09935 [Aquirhabdus parva]